MRRTQPAVRTRLPLCEIAADSKARVEFGLRGAGLMNQPAATQAEPIGAVPQDWGTNAPHWQEQTHVQGTYHHRQSGEPPRKARVRDRGHDRDRLIRAEARKSPDRPASIAESYAGEDHGRLVLFNANIPIYEPARDNHELRVRGSLVMSASGNKLLALSAAKA